MIHRKRALYLIGYLAIGCLVLATSLSACSTARHLAQLGEADARAELAKAWTVTIYERAF